MTSYHSRTARQTSARDKSRPVVKILTGTHKKVTMNGILRSRKPNAAVIRLIRKSPIIIANLWRGLCQAVRDGIHYIVVYFPGLTGKKLRYHYYRKRLKYMGQNVRIDPGVYFQHPELISIGDNCWIDFGVMLLASKPNPPQPSRLLRGKNQELEGEVILGKNVHLAPYCNVSGMGGLKIGDNVSVGSMSSIYTYTRISSRPSVHYCNGMVIEDDVVIGTKCTLIGVPHIKAGSVVQPNTYLSEVFGKKPTQPP